MNININITDMNDDPDNMFQAQGRHEEAKLPNNHQFSQRQRVENKKRNEKKHQSIKSSLKTPLHR